MRERGHPAGKGGRVTGHHQGVGAGGPAMRPLEAASLRRLPGPAGQLPGRRLRVARAAFVAWMSSTTWDSSFFVIA